MTDLLRFWGKTTREGAEFHPALLHMLDVGQIARTLLADPTITRWRRVLGRVLGENDSTLADWLPWLVALHDIGKISAAFQMNDQAQAARLRSEGVPLGTHRWDNDPHHTLISQVSVDGELGRLVAIPDGLKMVWREVVGGHHGRFAIQRDTQQARGKLHAYEPALWSDLRSQAAAVLRECLLVTSRTDWPQPRDISAAIMALTGFTILCDWLGSDERWFKPRTQMQVAEYARWSAFRARDALEQAGLLHESASTAPTHFEALFPDKRPVRPLQEAVNDIPKELLAGPCLVVIEAPTGEGKTEAAFALAHRIAQANGTEALYYALPTMATSNQMFGRVQQYVRDRLGLSTAVKLIHGQAFLVEDDLRLEPLHGGDSEDTRMMLEWFGPRKKALLSPIGVGTIDQVELAALNVRHSALRLAGLAGKVVILDEVHAYDLYMTTIVERLLEWLSALQSSVILLSATLPRSRRAALTQAFGFVAEEGACAYPSLWVAGRAGYYAASPAAYQPNRRLGIESLHRGDEEAVAKARWLLDAVAEGGCACWICNTVQRAQDIFQAVRVFAPADVDLSLLHARFPLEDREALEKRICDQYGPGQSQRPRRGIVIGTQVLEQSLDLDFDVMVSDLAPVDLLLQRAGRLHRHGSRVRPENHSTPRLWVNTDLDPNGVPALKSDCHIYAEYILRRTWEVLQGRNAIILPTDYRTLVEAVYGIEEPAGDDPLRGTWEQLQRDNAKARGEAELRLLPKPDATWSFCAAAGRLSFEESEREAGWIIARTRLGDEGDSVTVIPLERVGERAILPDGNVLELDTPASRELQLRLLRRSLRVSHRDAVERLRGQAEKLPRLFRDGALLRDVIPLWLEQGRAHLGYMGKEVVLTLDPVLGLMISKGGT